MSSQQSTSWMQIPISSRFTRDSQELGTQAKSHQETEIAKPKDKTNAVYKHECQVCKTKYPKDVEQDPLRPNYVTCGGCQLRSICIKCMPIKPGDFISCEVCDSPFLFQLPPQLREPIAKAVQNRKNSGKYEKNKPKTPGQLSVKELCQQREKDAKDFFDHIIKQKSDSVPSGFFCLTLVTFIAFMIIEIVILSSKTFLPTLREHRAAQNSLKESLNQTNLNPFHVEELQECYYKVLHEIQENE